VLGRKIEMKRINLKSIVILMIWFVSTNATADNFGEGHSVGSADGTTTGVDSNTGAPQSATAGQLESGSAAAAAALEKANDLAALLGDSPDAVGYRASVASLAASTPAVSTAPNVQVAAAPIGTMSIPGARGPSGLPVGIQLDFNNVPGSVGFGGQTKGSGYGPAHK
jgi:hypothetical protein